MKFITFFTLILSLSLHAQVQTFGVIGDAGNWTEKSKGVRDSLLKSKITDLIMPGDNLYDLSLTYEDAWGPWKAKGITFPIVAIGNHFKSYEEEMKYFGMPKEYYAKTIGRIRFIVLNSDNEKTVNEQARFLEEELKNTADQFTFIVFHHPPFTLRHGWQEKKDFHLKVRPILMEYKKTISGLLVGHDHIASFVDMDGLPVIVSGAVFESFLIPGIDNREFGYPVKTKWVSRGAHYWTRLDVNEISGEAWVNFVRSEKDEVSCSVRIAPKPFVYRENCSR